MINTIHRFFNFLFAKSEKSNSSENITAPNETVSVLLSESKEETAEVFRPAMPKEKVTAEYIPDFCFERLHIEDSSFYITKPKTYTVNHTFKQETVLKVFDFAYDMSFGKAGQHRNHRSGGKHLRKNGEVFANVFQGKLAECAVYNKVYKCGNVRTVDFNKYELGKWDDADIVVNGFKIAVKSTKSFGNLLLLETKDWNSKGQYIPNIDTDNAVYDYIAVARIKPNCENLSNCAGGKVNIYIMDIFLIFQRFMSKKY